MDGERQKFTDELDIVQEQLKLSKKKLDDQVNDFADEFRKKQDLRAQIERLTEF